MIRNKIYTVVEGHGEADSRRSSQTPAITILVGKLLTELRSQTLFPGKRPWRMSSSGDFYKRDKLERVLRAFKEFEDCAAVLILVDVDENCPILKAHEITSIIQNMEPLPFCVVVVCVKCEYEAWFLASLETIHRAITYPGNPESIRDAKGWLRKSFGYKQVQDQASYTRKLDIALAQNRSRSFRRLYHAFEEILHATEEGKIIITPAKQTES
jgi:hypothetical protein